MQFSITLDGEPEIRRRLAALTPALERRVISGAMRRAGNLVKAQAQANIVADVRVTGRNTDPLRTGIQVRAARRRRNRVGVIVQTPTRVRLGLLHLGRQRRLSVEAVSELKVGQSIVESKWYYPAHIELGTKRTTAQPYMRNALETQRKDAEEVLRQEILAGLERVIRT